MRLRLTLALLFLLIWQVASFFVESYLLPSPSKTFNTLYRLADYQLVITMSQSFFRLLVAYFFSMIIALILGFISQKWDLFHEAVEIISSSMLKIPNIAYLTFFMLFVGIGTPTIFLTITFSVIPTATLAILATLKQSDKNVIEISDIFNVPFHRRVFYFYTPTLITSLQSIFNLTFSLAFKVMIMAEFIAGMNGLGYKLVEKKASFNMDEVLAYILVIVIAGVISQKILEFLVKKVKRWI